MRILHKPQLFIPLASLIFGVTLVNAGCSKKDQNLAPPPPPTVVVAEVTRRTVPIYSEFVGQTKAEDTVELRARVEGILTAVSFREGSRVRKGQLLFTIDKRTYQATLQSAQALLAKAESDLAQARQRTDVLQAQAELADAMATLSKADQDVARFRPLAREKAVTEQDLDAAIAAQKSATAIVESRRANLKNFEAAVKYTIERAQAEVSASKARVIQAQLDLSYCNVYSPIDGVIGFQQVDVGNLVGRGDATLLATVSRSDPLLVDFNLSESDFLRLTDRETSKDGKQPAKLNFELILSDETKHPYAGTFKVLDRTVDPQTGTLKVQTSFQNPDSYLRPGQFARLRVAVAQRENAVLVPERAVQDLQGAKTVLIVDAQNKASVRTITLGDRSDNYVVVLQGLEGGEKVIVEGMQKVRPGSEVKPTTAAVTANSEQATAQR